MFVAQPEQLLAGNVEAATRRIWCKESDGRNQTQLRQSASVRSDAGPRCRKMLLCNDLGGLVLKSMTPPDRAQDILRAIEQDIMRMLAGITGRGKTA